MNAKAGEWAGNLLNALVIDEPLEYASLALDGEMQAWVDALY